MNVRLHFYEEKACILSKVQFVPKRSLLSQAHDSVLSVNKYSTV